MATHTNVEFISCSVECFEAVRNWSSFLCISASVLCSAGLHLNLGSWTAVQIETFICQLILVNALYSYLKKPTAIFCSSRLPQFLCHWMHKVYMP